MQVNTEEPEYVWYQMKVWPIGAIWILKCKWCVYHHTWMPRSREHFRDCCGPSGFGPDDWFTCTRCDKWGYFGEDVPDNYNLNFVIRFDYWELLCNQRKVRKSVCVPIANPWME